MNVSLVTNTGFGGDAQGDVLISIENLTGSAYADTLTGDVVANAIDGGAGNDRILGGAGADTLFGGLGNDTLYGGAGSDRLVGGGGLDVYCFDFSGFGRDIVSGFEWGFDRLDLRGAATSAQVTWSTSGLDLIVAIAGSTDAIVLEGQGGRQLAARDFIWAEAPACSLGALHECAELRPGDVRVHRAEAGEGRKPAIRPRDDALRPYDVGEAQNTLRNQFRVLHEVRRRVEAAGIST